MLSKVLLGVAASSLLPALANAQAPERVVIVDLAATDSSAAAVAELRERLSERSLSPANEPDVRGALENNSPEGENSLVAAKASLASANEHFADFSMRSAEAELRKAEALAVESLASGQTVSVASESLATLAEIHFVWGRVLEADGKKNAATHFGATARLDKARTSIDPATYKPALVELYRKAAALATSGKGGLALTGRPDNATISINGVAVGTLPISVDDLAKGRHYVAIEANGYKGQAMVADVGSTRVRLNVELEPLSRSEKLSQLRKKLLAGTGGPVLESLAQTAAATMVIVVREGSMGALEVAAFRVGEALGPWGPPSMLTFRAAEAAGTAVPPVSETPMVVGASPKEARPWYLTWKGAAAAGALVGIATVAVILVASGDTEFEVGGACSAGACP